MHSLLNAAIHGRDRRLLEGNIPRRQRRSIGRVPKRYCGEQQRRQHENCNEQHYAAFLPWAR
jgi:hypothetical protein